MITRVSTSSMQSNLVAQIANNQNKLYELQMQAMTGNKVNSILDNPVDASKILVLNEELSKIESYKKNINAAQGEYDAMDNALNIVVEKLQRINELANSAANEYNTPENLQAIKTEVTTIKQTIMDMANTQYNDKFIFSGTNTGTPAYKMAADGTLTYQGTPSTGDYKRQLEVAEGTYLTLNAAGDNVFGTYNAANGTGSGVFKTISDLEAAIDAASSTDATISADGFSKIRSSITATHEDIETVTGVRSRYGTYAQKADLSENSLEENSILLQSDRSDLQNVDLFEIYSNLTYQQYALQASMQVGAMTLQQSSLLNYI
ncbi:flagellar hook-associated protein FlgL [bacterium]|nr:flagellar hook-associated protein FlgL [bacterium]